MSKNIRRQPQTTTYQTNVGLALSDALSKNEIREENAVAARAHQDHAFTNQVDDEPGTHAPLGLDPSAASQVSGNTLFDEVFNLSSIGQLTVLRALANSALYSAIMSAHTRVSWDGPTEDDGTLNAAELKRLAYYESLPVRINQQRALYEYAAKEAFTLSSSEFDAPMDFDTMFDFAANNASQQQVNDDLPDDVLEALGITRAQLKVIDADEQKRQARRDADLRASLKDLRSSIAAEIGGLVPDLGNDEVTTTFTAEQHVKLYEKAVKKLQAKMAQLLGIRHRYDGALGDAMLLASDVKTLDKAYAAFRRRNSAELRDAA